MMKKIGLWGIGFLVMAIVLGGCGYTRKTVLPRNIKTIYVETVKNKLDMERVYAYHQGLEMDITNAVIRRFQQDGTVKVAREQTADAILKTDLLAFEQEGLRYDQLEGVKEYRLFVVVKLRLVDAKTGDLIWEEPNFTGDNEYYVSTVTSLAQEKAATEVVDKLAANIVDRVVQDW
jgi:hypothetical protein